MSFYILAQFKVKPDQLSRTLKHLKALEDAAHNDEPGTLIYTITQDPADKLKFTIWEEYASEQAFKDHQAAPPFSALSLEIPELLEGPLAITRLDKYQP
ncbi:hypothetical protein DB88DRAFT_494370 [Papiliotrema laurentii]|uniref:ABM domain-containing protein n=1 Tax=Papiliotrema laurentii TaxID=5418 RepID=A0AAD9CWI3_PAPLA|nr:hypothetical protein DB88DRAFT_494370 [Papiliotrema laurentii]